MCLLPYWNDWGRFYYTKINGKLNFREMEVSSTMEVVVVQ